MKIELQVKGKEVVIPEFDIFLDKSGIYTFLILDQFNEIDKSEINSDKSKILFDENNLILELSKKYFIFNLDDFEGFKNKKNSIAFVYSNTNGIVEQNNIRIFSFIIS